MKPNHSIELDATTAKAARTEIRARWPQYEVDYTGYDEDGMDVLLSCVRRKGDKAGVATAKRNRSKPAVKFVATVWR